ncbi:recombinase family protein [Streptomyces sp. BPTC-684]|uniref:recombinase family protein n=1 Tax=Streptomyces sp. BPTC-684 TaxID=3043734 RepID=UPI0024B12563|nr:recombinase family protein [Streptomyces sp. BPTC-684]WHM37467.1 recombinase family protein [Streptomyces sp. BPTC-684]
MTDTTTSPARQRRAGQLWAKAHGATVIGEATDLDVSASRVDPFSRPELGKWLAQPDDYDAIVFWRLDRAVRSMADMAKLGDWARKNGKLLVFAEGPGGTALELDMRATSLVSELIIMLLAFAAQMEAEAIRERVKGSRSHLRHEGRWHGGRVPFGWAVVPNPTGPGFVLDECPETGPIVREIVRRVIAGESIYAVANDLDEREIATPSDREKHRMTGTIPEKRKRWDHQYIAAMLRSEHLRGYTMHDPKATEKRSAYEGGGEWEKWTGRPVLDRNGHPRMDRPALVDDETWAVLQEVMKTKKRPETMLRAAGSLLVRVAYCAGVNRDGTVCNRPMYGSSKKATSNGKPVPNGGHIRVYRCKERGAGHSVTVKAETLDKWAEEQFLMRLGHMQVKAPVTDPGEDHTADLERVRESIKRLRRDRDAGLYDGEDDEAEYNDMMRSLLKERRELEAMPLRPPSTHWVPTGRTFADMWRNEETEGKRRLLLDAGARITVTSGKRSGARFDYERLTFAIGEHEDPAAAELAAIAAELEDEAAMPARPVPLTPEQHEEIRQDLLDDIAYQEGL